MQAGRGPRPPKTRPLIIPNPLTVNLTVDGSLSGVPAPGGRDFHLLVNAGQRLTVVEWAIVFDVPVGLPFCDPVPMAPRAPAGTPQAMAQIVAAVGTKACALYALCRALPAFCTLCESPQECSTQPDGQETDSSRGACWGLRCLATQAYKTAKLERLSQVDMELFLPALGLWRLGNAGHTATEELQMAYFADAQVFAQCSTSDKSAIVT
mmetsp:Transcript_37639/g.106340  ORF Transcript_37639/g.106340 Transcript_37639/m.106340 type:complete len:209 (+) Transcript_37639:807-1433(+)